MISNTFSHFLQLINFAAFNSGRPCNDRLATENANNGFLGFPHWWKYIKNGETDALGNCNPKVKFPDDLLAIGFAIIDMLLYAAGIAAIIFIIVGAVTYMTASGNGEKAAAARKRILNAIIGLIIVLLAVAVVSFIGQKLG